MKFEILISTMFRTNLSFLEPMFSKNNIEDYNILIINQTDASKILKSNLDNISVINSFERGTSASRNLGLKNATAEICLFADDDTVFKPHFKEIILKEFNEHNNAYMVTFEAVDKNNIPHLNYCKAGLHNKKTLKTIHMIVMAVKPKLLLEKEVFFNDYFSLGGKFSGATEYVFLRNALHQNLTAYHQKKIIVEHHELSSGKQLSSDRVIHTRSARKNHFTNSFIAILWLLKYILFLLRKRLITFKEVYPKFKVGLKGIDDYNDLLNKGLIKRQQ